MAIHQPHDHLFRRVFGAPAEAASFLQAQLPAALRRSLRWSTLKRHPTSYVTPDLHGTASDLLFEVRYVIPGAARSLRPPRRRAGRLLAHSHLDCRCVLILIVAGQDDIKMFVQYMMETGPDDTPDELDEILSHTTAALRGELMRTSGERLRQEGRDEGRLKGQREGRLVGQREGRLEGQREARLETIDGFLRTGIDWSVIEQATGIGEQEYRKLKRQSNGEAAANGAGT